MGDPGGGEPIDRVPAFLRGAEKMGGTVDRVPAGSVPTAEFASRLLCRVFSSRFSIYGLWNFYLVVGNFQESWQITEKFER
jgi:hypothetical protein